MTYVERQPGESANDRNDRAIRKACSWFQSHLEESQNMRGHSKKVKMVLLTQDVKNREIAIKEGINAYKGIFVAKLWKTGSLLYITINLGQWMNTWKAWGVFLNCKRSLQLRTVTETSRTENRSFLNIGHLLKSWLESSRGRFLKAHSMLLGTFRACFNYGTKSLIIFVQTQWEFPRRICEYRWSGTVCSSPGSREFKPCSGWWCCSGRDFPWRQMDRS